MIKTQHCPNCEAQAAEIDRLKTLIDATAEHWMVLQSKHSIQWEGAIDSAMAAACAEIETLLADNAKLREAVKEIEASTYPRPLGKSWRMDLSSSKHDRCIHDEWMYDTCEGCLDDFIRKALQETER